MYIFQKPPSLLDTAHGFEQVGDTLSPYTLRGGGERKANADAIHADRPTADQQEDENSNEPITLEIETWEDAVWKLDFPHVDTIPHATLFDRATRVLEFAERNGYVNTSELDGDIDETDVLGYFDPVPRRIVVDTDPDDFLGARKGPTVAHELGHAFDLDIGQKSERAGFDENKANVFDTDGAREDAIRLSERLRGTIPEGEGEYSSYRLSEEELLADTFALLIVEPKAAERVGPRAVECLKDYMNAVVDEIVA